MTGRIDSATALDAVPQPYLDDGDVVLYHGDVIQTLRQLPAGIAQTCVTSPPYWGLRDYGTGEWTGGDTACDHQRQSATSRASSGLDGATTTQGGSYAWGDMCGRCGARRVDSQLGLEATPDQYVERMVAVFREVRRVLADTGTVWCNLGDSFLPGKQLAAIPWRVAFALQTDGWYLRSDIIWNKPNPMPESVSDRPTKAHEYLFLLAKRPRYYFDADAIREPHMRLWEAEKNGDGPNFRGNVGYEPHRGDPNGPNPAGRNRRSVWTIPTEPFPEAHFATYPQALVRPCILAGTSEHGECSSCGAPWMRQTDRSGGDTEFHERPKRAEYGGASTSTLSLSGNGSREWADRGSRRETTGWSPSCSCQQGGTPGQVWDIGGGPKPTRPQLVLDPFIGSGTTALVARNHARRCIGIDLSSEYLAIAARRLQQLSLLGGTT